MTKLNNLIRNFNESNTSISVSSILIELGHYWRNPSSRTLTRKERLDKIVDYVKKQFEDHDTRSDWTRGYYIGALQGFSNLLIHTTGIQFIGPDGKLKTRFTKKI